MSSSVVLWLREKQCSGKPSCVLPVSEYNVVWSNHSHHHMERAEGEMPRVREGSRLRVRGGAMMYLYVYETGYVYLQNM